MAQDYQKTQDSIVRQSTLKFVVDYCRVIGTPLTLKEIVGITNVLTEFCQDGYSKEIGERLDKIDSHIQSKFEETITHQ
jgi:hypothetical protein